MKELRAWVAPLVAGNQHLAPLIANNVRRRFSLRAKLRPVARALRGKKQQSLKITVAAHVSTGICFPGRGHIALSGT